jgi:hypothetical protein
MGRDSRGGRNAHAFRFGLEAVGAGGGFVEDGGLVGGGEVGDEGAGGFEPAEVGAGEFGDGPIAAEEEAGRAEGFEEVGDVGLELLGRPGGVIGFGDEAGEFADDIGERGELADVFAPRIEEGGADARFAGVVEDELNVGTGANEGDDGGELRVFAADVEGEICGGELADAGDEFGAGAEIDGLVFEVVADAADERVAGELGDVGGGLRAAIDEEARDEGGEAGFGGGELFDPGEFGGGGRAGFDEDDFIGEIGGGFGVEVFGGVAVPDGRDLVQPGVGHEVAVPEVHVGIDVAHGVGCGVKDEAREREDAERWFCFSGRKGRARRSGACNRWVVAASGAGVRNHLPLTPL